MAHGGPLKCGERAFVKPSRHPRSHLGECVAVQEQERSQFVEFAHRFDDIGQSKDFFRLSLVEESFGRIIAVRSAAVLIPAFPAKLLIEFFDILP
jgi:hypothetical protein